MKPKAWFSQDFVLEVYEDIVGREHPSCDESRELLTDICSRNPMDGIIKAIDEIKFP